MSVLTLEGVARTYAGPPPVEALKTCDVVVEPGGLVTVTGPSGSGKSTLLNIAGLLDRPTGGRVIVEGKDTSSLSERARSQLRGRHIGFVFQAFHLMARRSVLDNVRLAGLYQGASEAERSRRARSAIEKVGLMPRLEAPASVLSGGERQRVAIARAIAGQPALLLCDEPTGNLDSQNSASVVSLLEELNRTGIAVLIITHDAHVASVGRQRFHVKDGVVSGG